jgi:beta-glucosidase/6-phospho-beta-glucosidase/beta-galactosidase
MKDFLKNLLGTAISSFAGSFYPVIALGGLLFVSNAGHFVYEYVLRQNVKNLKLQIELITNDTEIIKQDELETAQVNSYTNSVASNKKQEISQEKTKDNNLLKENSNQEKEFLTLWNEGLKIIVYK